MYAGEVNILHPVKVATRQVEQRACVEFAQQFRKLPTQWLGFLHRRAGAGHRLGPRPSGSIRKCAGSVPRRCRSAWPSAGRSGVAASGTAVGRTGAAPARRFGAAAQSYSFREKIHMPSATNPAEAKPSTHCAVAADTGSNRLSATPFGARSSVSPDSYSQLLA